MWKWSQPNSECRSLSSRVRCPWWCELGACEEGIIMHLLHLLPWQADSLPLHHLGNPMNALLITILGPWACQVSFFFSCAVVF